MLGLDSIDLYLVHAPPEDIDARAEVWRGMEECLARGWTKSIGVSNYGALHLDDMQTMPPFTYCSIRWIHRNQLSSVQQQRKLSGPM